MGFLKWLFRKNGKEQERKKSDCLKECVISNNYHLVNISREDLERWKIEKHDKDKVRNLLKQDGFYIKKNFRVGTIYFVDKTKICEIYYEQSRTKQFDILIFFEDLKEWFFPENKEITDTEKNEIREKLIVWLDKEKIKSDL